MAVFLRACTGFSKEARERSTATVCRALLEAQRRADSERRGCVLDLCCSVLRAGGAGRTRRWVRWKLYKGASCTRVNKVILTSTSKSEELNGGRLESWKAVEEGGRPTLTLTLNSAERQRSNQRSDGL